MFGDGRHDVDRETVRLREIHCFKFDFRLHQVGDEGHVTGQAVQLVDGGKSTGPKTQAGSARIAEVQRVCGGSPIERGFGRSEVATKPDLKANYLLARPRLSALPKIKRSQVVGLLVCELLRRENGSVAVRPAVRVTVRFTMAGVTSFRCLVVVHFTVPERGLFVQHTFYEQLSPAIAPGLLVWRRRRARQDEKGTPIASRSGLGFTKPFGAATRRAWRGQWLQSRQKVKAGNYIARRSSIRRKFKSENSVDALEARRRTVSPRARHGRRDRYARRRQYARSAGAPGSWHIAARRA
jgi:hypothetical protein